MLHRCSTNSNVSVVWKINLGLVVFIISSNFNNENPICCFRRCGFSDGIETYGLISGLWTSTFALGAFIGPSVSGLLYDSVGFRKAVLFVIILQAVVGFIVVIMIFLERKPQPYKELSVTEPLLRRHDTFYNDKS